MLTLTVLLALLVASAVIPTSMTIASPDSKEQPTTPEDENQEQETESQDDQPQPEPEPDDDDNNGRDHHNHNNHGKDRDHKDNKNSNHVDIKVIEKNNDKNSDELGDIKQTIVAIDYDNGAGINCVIDEDDNGKCETFNVNKDSGKDPLLVIIPFDN